MAWYACASFAVSDGAMRSTVGRMLAIHASFARRCSGHSRARYTGAARVSAVAIAGSIVEGSVSPSTSASASFATIKPWSRRWSRFEIGSYAVSGSSHAARSVSGSLAGSNRSACRAARRPASAWRNWWRFTQKLFWKVKIAVAIIRVVMVVL